MHEVHRILGGRPAPQGRTDNPANWPQVRPASGRTSARLRAVNCDYEETRQTAHRPGPVPVEAE